ncbi:MAG: UDP-GlcNAc--UDP-phosphate GlcNAc-1-phosphate transferase [Chlorobi bacterium]|nr:UDP-GlcNAc--UDP-phosphate GlcNAc-1-phosphate transferase [Chlorobiota bacterium]
MEIKAAEWILIGAGLWALLQWYRRYAERKGIYDIPSARSSHDRPVLRGGGIIFAAAVMLALVRELQAFADIRGLSFAFGFFLLALTGFIDDRKNLSPRIRFLIQALAITLILYSAGWWEAPFPAWIKAAGFVVALGFVNAYNFMDGINGITGLYTLVLLGTYIRLNREFSLIPDSLFSYAVIALMIFGWFNFRRRALIFAGDVGSMSLAALLLWIIMRFLVHLEAPVLILTVAVYGVDSAMTIIFRLLKKQNIFEAHRWHVYQKLVDRYRWPHMRVSMAYALVQGLINFWLIRQRAWAWSLDKQMAILFFTLFGLILFYIFFQKDRLIETPEKQISSPR